MENKYQLWIVVDGKEFEIELKTLLSELEAEGHLEELKTTNNGYFGLSNGDMIAVNKESCNFYFICKKAPINIK